LIERFAANVVVLRRERGWYQTQLAHACGCHCNFISNIERGRVNATLGTLEMLARGLCCTESDLLSASLPSAME
jgi:transcriptional regulator with XRE-family HTH domain